MAAKLHSLPRTCFNACTQKFLGRSIGLSKLKALFVLSLVLSLLVFSAHLLELNHVRNSHAQRVRLRHFQLLWSRNAFENHTGSARNEKTHSENKTLGNEDSAKRDTAVTVAPRALRDGKSEHSDRASNSTNDFNTRERTPSAQNARRHPQPKAVSQLNKHAADTSAVLTKNQNGTRDNQPYWTDIPNTLPAWVRYGLHWTEGPIAKGFPHWQVVDTKVEVFVYSAHLDILVSPPIVRVIGLLHKMISIRNVTCRFYDDLHGPSMHSVSGVAYHCRNLNGRMYVAAFVDCPLVEREGYLPYAVSLTTRKEGNVTNFLIVHYSQSDSWLQQHNDEFFRKTRPKNLDGETQSQDHHHHPTVTEDDSYAEGSGTGRSWNITRCFPALYGNFDDHVMLAEMVAASLATGVERFVFYVQSVGPNVTRLLQTLRRRGIAEVHPWNLQLPRKVFYAGQVSCISECLYRHSSSSRFVLFGDIDELFVPRKHRSLLPLLEDVLNEKSKCGAVTFRNVFFDLKHARKALPHHLDPSGYALTHQLNMLTHTRRVLRVWPNLRRSKIAVDPKGVISVSVHGVEIVRKGYKLCEMPPTQGLLHHYRILTPKQTGPTAEGEDSYLGNYASDILAHVKDLFQDFHADSKVRVPRELPQNTTSTG